MSNTNELDPTTLGSRLRAARQAAGLSQAELERMSGIPKARLSRYENAHVEPSIRTLLRLSSALGTPAGQLVDPESWNELTRRLEVATSESSFLKVSENG
jgi:transcriptional regulator with XRE-family HTH domain